MKDSLSGFIASLTHLDPRAPLDDLEPLRELIGSARVVALGESAHGQREFHLMHHRVLRFLVEQAGFTAFAKESGFSEGRAVDAYVQGASGDALAVSWYKMTYGMGKSLEMADLVAWMREHNASGRSRLSFIGVDPPGGCGSLGPALDNLELFLAPLDPIAAGLISKARELITPVEFWDNAHAAQIAYDELSEEHRDRLTATLSNLQSRLVTLAPSYRRHAGALATAKALHEVELAIWLDRHWRWTSGDPAMRGEAFTDGSRVSGLPRCVAMASTILWLLEQQPEARVVFVAHNGHVQRVPSVFGTTAPAFPCGAYLAEALGEDYVSVALTATAGETVALQPDPTLEAGWRRFPATLAPPVEGSIEHVLRGAAALSPVILNARAAREHGLLADVHLLRAGDTYRELSVSEAHDAVVQVPHVRMIEPPAAPDWVT